MQKNRLNILSTRPLADSIIHEAAQYNLDIECISFIETESVNTPGLNQKLKQLASQKIDVVFTSMNAVEAVREQVSVKPSWKIFSIGQTTKELIEDFLGESSIGGTADDASHLADVIIQHQPEKVFFFCGDQRRDELPKKLSDAGIPLEEIVVYKTHSTSQTINKDYDGILFFSPSAVESFFATNKISDNAVVFAIGNTTAITVKQKVNNKIVIADKPGKDELVKKMLAYFNQQKQGINE